MTKLSTSTGLGLNSLEEGAENAFLNRGRTGKFVSEPSDFLTVARAWSYEFENVREDMWAGVADMHTRVRSMFYDPPPAISSPLQPSVVRSAPNLE